MLRPTDKVSTAWAGEKLSGGGKIFDVKHDWMADRWMPKVSNLKNSQFLAFLSLFFDRLSRS